MEQMLLPRDFNLRDVGQVPHELSAQFQVHSQ